MHYRSITAKILIDIKAVNFKPDDPYTLTSGRKSPVYVDCRKIISFTNERNTILQFAEDYISENKLDFDIIAGGETAGIPYAAFLSERLKKPMIYVRKKPKGFGKKSQIEGQFEENQKCILIEDLATDGASKISFINAMRDNNISITDTFVIFYYDTFNSSKTELEKLGIKIHCLCNWNDILEIVKKEKMLLNSEILKIEKFLFDNDEKDYE